MHTSRQGGLSPGTEGSIPLSSNQDNKGKGGGGPRRRGFFIGAILWALILVIFFNFLANQIANAGTQEVPYSEFIEMVEQDKVATAELTANKITFYLKEDLPAGVEGSTAEPSQDLAQVLTQQMEQGGATRYVTAPVAIGEGDTDLIPLLKEHNVTYFSPMQEESSYLVTLLLSYVVPIILMVALLVFLMRRLGGMGGLGGVGKANAKVYMEKSTGVTFADVAGQDEAKESLVEIIDFLHNPGKYTEIGAKLPKGALLVGPPGTGKTLLAKAVAGEANVPFFSISGSDFVEMFVGVGASRVRDLFKEANKVAPCIVFIDEIDTIGKKRDGSGIAGNDEREQTLNQLLSEMDGFDGSSGVVILAATNRPETLDKALLRPGRFDRRVPVELPDLQGREAILRVHAKDVMMADDIDYKAVARATSGASGAELANLINEAALRAVKCNRRIVTQEDLTESVDVVVAGYQRKNAVLSPHEKEIVAYHEIGHALVAALQSNSAPVTKITIVPRTSGALGYTMQTPEADTVLLSKEEALAKIATLTGGRSAEELIFDSVTSGASNDIEQATKLARSMVTRLGMSETFDMTALETVSNQYLGGDAALACSAETATKIDKEVVEIIRTAHEKAIGILKDNMDKLHELAKYLLEKETITGDEFMAILNR